MKSFSSIVVRRAAVPMHAWIELRRGLSPACAALMRQGNYTDAFDTLIEVLKRRAAKLTSRPAMAAPRARGPTGEQMAESNRTATVPGQSSVPV